VADDTIHTPEYQGPDRRKILREDEIAESKLALYQRSSNRAHSTEHSEYEDAITEINVTPLVDVSLVLVIIFMAISPFMLKAGIMVSESKAGAAKGKVALDKNVQITLSSDGLILVNGKAVLIQDLLKKLKVEIPKSKDGLVTLQAEQENLVGEVVEILDISKQSGAKKVAILNKTNDKEK